MITDYNMPEINGIELVKAIREKSKVPVLIISGMGQEVQKEFTNLEPITFLAKPFKVNEIVDLLQIMHQSNTN